MGQMGFFDLGNRYSGLDAKNEPLLKIDGVVPWEDLRARLEAVWRRADKVRKSRAGRKPWDAIVMFKTIILCALYNLSDDQVEHQIRDRLSFMRFLGLGLEGRVPDAKTVWLYREQLTQAGVIEALFETFDGYLKDQGYLAMGGQIIDASIVAVPKQRNSREENAQDKGGRDAGRLGGQAGKAAPKGCRGAVDQEARQEPLRLQKPCQRGPSAQAGAALSCERRGGARQPSPATISWMGTTRLWVCGRTALTARRRSRRRWKEKGLRSRIHRKGRRNKPLSEREKQGNKTRSSVRVRVEHVFGAQSNDMGGTLVRSVGLVRAKARIGLKNLAYNMRRLVQLERLAAAV